ncbi:hypothetical protein HanXRQr2_Chr10g0460211 [Helianthus annuus]|uniref:Uncharacterized protein n=1 Tax=Helianthus annuus TaxID=4232 RepID=A0A251TQ40_HELAN|nr:hypothetical protein HanXRQr2_Chr10g0460211 [Helianthus annuus]KAJ0885351.1 hypothetical protein HanPSC8_Chr10g0444311 [Helianthus annuus]
MDPSLLLEPLHTNCRVKVTICSERNSRYRTPAKIRISCEPDLSYGENPNLQVVV